MASFSTQARSGWSFGRALQHRDIPRIANVIMLTLTGLAALSAIVPLVWIILDVVVRGAQGQADLQE